MTGTGAFNYINVLEKACDASWTRNSVLANNIANVDTPNYKRKDVQFEEYMLTATTYTEYTDVSYRIDGNNVDIDTESSELAKNQIKYYTMLDSVSQEFNRIKSVIKSN